MTLVGVIADTHGLLRAEVMTAFEKVDRILHAGDVGRPEIIDALRTLAPVTAIRGNVDYGRWADALPFDTVASIEGRDIYLIHNLEDIRIDPAAAHLTAVVSGHTHKPVLERQADVLYMNPGSAGPRRFALPISIGFMRIMPGESVQAWLQTFDL
ncbi:MAG TPA: metallophosphoesterase family protein [Hyphomicrobiales bacterium]|nr:metallophosphoesterase family protein [Hyphomicrobiales bacterium]